MKYRITRRITNISPSFFVQRYEMTHTTTQRQEQYNNLWLEISIDDPFLSFLSRSYQYIQHSVYPPTQKQAHTHAYIEGGCYDEEREREMLGVERERMKGNRYYSAADGSFRDYHLYHHHHHHKEHNHCTMKRSGKEEGKEVLFGSEIKKREGEVWQKIKRMMLLSLREKINIF